MTYTEYFSKKLKEDNCTPNFTLQQFKDFMNIVSLEARIKVCAECRYESAIKLIDVGYNSQVKLQSITRGKTPQEMYDDITSNH